MDLLTQLDEEITKAIAACKKCEHKKRVKHQESPSDMAIEVSEPTKKKKRDRAPDAQL